MSDDDRAVQCSECGTMFSDEEAALVLIGAKPRPPCANCGATSVKISLHLHGEAVAHTSMRAKAKRPGLTGGPFLKMKVGDNFHVASGTWHKIVQVADRLANRYRKRVVDADGNVVRDVDVPLDEHKGHGDDKSQPKAHP